jgi:phospholipase C
MPIEHLVIACQENRSFDHYYGYAPQVQEAGFGPAAGCFQPDSSGGGKHYPFEFTSLTTADPPHSWSAVHHQVDGGAMDGFWQDAQDRIGDGDAAIGYYTARELPFYYSLFDDSALCANYYCRPRRTAAARRVRSQRARAAVGRLAAREGGAAGVGPAGRAHLDAEADRGASRAADAHEPQRRLRRVDPDRI